MDTSVKKLPAYMQPRTKSGVISRYCSVEGCAGAHTARGYCMRHYTRMVRRGMTDPESPRDFELREPLSENEFCRMIDFKEQGFSEKDIAYELSRPTGIITEAIEHECYLSYTKREVKENRMLE